MNAQKHFVVRATGPTGIFWLSELSRFGLRTLVTRNRAATFRNADEAQIAISRMPGGYRLAGVSFAIESCESTHAERAAQLGVSLPSRIV
jgi:hypothetical protein